MACTPVCCECCVLLCIDQNVILFITNMGAEYSKGTNLFVIVYFENGVVLVFRNLYVFVRGQKCYFYREDAGRRFFRNNKYLPDCTQSHSIRQLSSVLI